MSQFEGLACCCHGDRPLQPLTLEVSAGLEWGLLGLTCEWLVRGGFYLSAPLINTVSLCHREHTLPHAHTLIPLSHSRAGVIISDNPHWQTVNSSYCTLLLTKHTIALHSGKVLTNRNTTAPGNISTDVNLQVLQSIPKVSIYGEININCIRVLQNCSYNVWIKCVSTGKTSDFWAFGYVT